ncbi:MAG: hypothetical protein V7695_06770 [Sulfitobacter sp.]
MSISIKTLVFAITVTLASAAQADAMCNGKPKIKLSDGGVACVLKKETTEITTTQSVFGAGPATARKSQHTGALLVVKFVGEKDASPLLRKVIRARVKELCNRYREEFLEVNKRPANPFMAIVTGYKTIRFSGTDRELRRPRISYLSKNCWIKR